MWGANNWVARHSDSRFATEKDQAALPVNSVAKQLEQPVDLLVAFDEHPAIERPPGDGHSSARISPPSCSEQVLSDAAIHRYSAQGRI
jgi:hypothetical protein